MNLLNSLVSYSPGLLLIDIPFASSSITASISFFIFLFVVTFVLRLIKLIPFM